VVVRIGAWPLGKDGVNETRGEDDAPLVGDGKGWNGADDPATGGNIRPPPETPGGGGKNGEDDGGG